MSIAPISGSSSAAYSPLNTNSAVKLLENQKIQLQKQIEEVKESKMDSKMKQEKITELNEQITEIDRQIWQKKMEKINPEKNQDTKMNIDGTNYESSRIKGEKTGDSAGINSKYMFSAASGYSDLKTMGKVRTELQGQLRLATSSGENPEAGKGIQEKLDSLEGNMLKKEKEINEDLKKAAKETGKSENQNLSMDKVNETESPQDDNDIGIDKDQEKSSIIIDEEEKSGLEIGGEEQDAVLPPGSKIDVRA